MFLRAVKDSFLLLTRETTISLLHNYTSLTKTHHYRGKKNLKLYLGSGSVRKSGWINVDINRICDLRLDLRRKLLFEDGSAKYIFSEHFLEHLSYPNDALFHLRECHRLLESGGVLRVGIPDTRWPIECYLEGSESRWIKTANEKNWHPNCFTPMEHLNYHFRQHGEHLYAYDFETLKRVLQLAGFSKISRSKFDSTTDTQERKIGTLYVNAIK